MATNPYFKHYTHQPLQKLTEDLIIQAIKMYGYNVKYLPKRLVNQDKLYKDDPMSIFEHAIDLEVWIKDTKGFQGDRELLSKFRLEVRDQINFTLSRRRFDQIRTEKVMTENSWNLILENSSTDSMGNYSCILSEGPLNEGYDFTTKVRPEEGDLIYFPLVSNVFEVRYVEFEDQNFYPFGKLMTYDLKCELFDYSSERIVTSNPEINQLDTEFSLDITRTQILMENGGVFRLEDDNSMIVENFNIQAIDSQAQNDSIQDLQFDIDFIDYTENNPFSKNRIL